MIVAILTGQNIKVIHMSIKHLLTCKLNSKTLYNR